MKKKFESHQENFAKAEMPEENICSTCNEEFSSRNKMFQHLQESGQAALKQQLKTKKKGKKK